MARIHVLPPETARLIAAGEVIDRPAALLRELLDNAIDAGASEVRVELQGGGIDSLLVVDDGSGMESEDLALAILPHATSKIRSADDLLKVRSLGFRGEALASIAAAAELEITTKTEGAREARRLTSRPGSAATIEPTHGPKGTRIQVRGLFDNFPARRQFLKRAQAEASQCRQVFADKALAHPTISFRYTSEGRLQDLVPACPSLRERVHAFHDEVPGDLLHEVVFSGEGFEGRVVLGGPAFYRNDRRLMGVFVNRRRVQEWTLLSGLDSAFEGFLPGGAHPFAFVFVEIDPAIADFNIHPAKREVRFRDPASLRHAMTSSMRNFLTSLAALRPEQTVRPAVESLGEALFGEVEEGESRGVGPYSMGLGRGYLGPNGAWGSRPASSGMGNPALRTGVPTSGQSGGATWESLLRERPFASSPGGPPPREDAAEKIEDERVLRLLGRAFGLFIIVERGEELYLIDQHAAHERIIFDELSARPPIVQELLVPVPLRLESDSEERRLSRLAPVLAEAGFKLEEAGGDWQLTALPSSLMDDPEGALRELIEGGDSDPLRSARAMTACRSAVKDGDELEAQAALELARLALALPEPRCPHGRPIWIKLSREELFRLVRRIV